MSFDHLRNRLEELKAQSRYRVLQPRRAEGARFWDGKRRLINFGSNDYLGLARRSSDVIGSRGSIVASDSKVARGSVASGSVASGSVARGSGASALVSGWTDEHALLADTIAKWEQCESAVIFPSGYAACSGTIATLGGKGDLILSDALNHASLIDGCRLSRAHTAVYPHRDVGWVETFLVGERHRFENIWIVTDGVFSMDGHVAPLRALASVAERFAANLIVDEAHATGVLGSGRGVCHELNVHSKVAIRIGTLSKAIGSQGGFACGPAVVIDYLINHCRPLIFSTSLSPMAVRSAILGFESLESEPWRRDKVMRLAREFRSRLGIASDAPEDGVPIIPIILGSDPESLSLSQRLNQAGYYVPAIRPPTVPEGTSRLRVSLSAEHDEGEVYALVRLLKSV
jgi:8-amino-7-oxononanoate synthase